MGKSKILSVWLAFAAVSVEALQVTFFERPDFQGSSKSMDFEGLACFDLPSDWNDKASSLSTHDSCILAFEHAECSGKTERIAPGTSGHSNLGDIQFDKMISSFRQCSPTPQTCSQLTVNLDFSEAPDLQALGLQMKETMEEWYPFVCRLLYSPNFPEIGEIKLYFDGVNDGVAGADAFGKFITVFAKYFRDHPNDVGAVIHEMAHVIQRYSSCAGWLTEGIADYPRRWWYEPEKPQKPGGSFEGNSHTYFLRWIDDKWPNTLYHLNKECREGSYNDNLLERLTGKNAEQLWSEMQNE